MSLLIPFKTMPRYSVVMVEPEFEESIGSMARVMKNFDIHDLRLVRPIVKLGSLGRSRAGIAQDVLDNVQTCRSLKDALGGMDLSAATTARRARSTYRILRRPMDPREFSDQMRNVQGTVALVFGREGSGLTNAELEICDMVVTIQAAVEYPTLNISHAGATIFYELYATSQTGPSETLANARAKEAALDFLNRAAAVAGLSYRERALALRSLRNIMGRSAIRAREASSLTGVLRAISAKLDRTGSPGSSTVSKEL